MIIGEFIPEKGIKLFEKIKKRSTEDALLEATLIQAGSDIENQQKMTQLKNQLEILFTEDQEFYDEISKLFAEAKKDGLTIKGAIKARDVYSKVNVVDLDEVPEGTLEIKGKGEFQNIKESGEVTIIRIKKFGD